MSALTSILTWEILWTEEPGMVQYMGLRKVRHDLVSKWQQQPVL